jgi:signal transduction histidine kinase
MNAKEQWLWQREKVLASLRVVFSLVAIAVIQISPQSAARHPVLGQFSLYSFFLYSLVVLYWIRKKEAPGKKLGLATTSLDFFWITLIVISIRGLVSPFFVFYLFPVITASFRYGIKGSFTAALVGIALYACIRFIPFFQRPIVPDLFLVRSAYLLVLAYIFGFLSELEMKQNEKLALLSQTAVEAAALDERRRIARVFHDHLLQVLATLGLRLENCRRHLVETPEELRREIESAENAVRGAIEDTRKFLQGKEPGNLMPGTLMEKLREELKFLRDKLGMRVTLECEPEDLSLPPEIEQELYYVLREGLVNITRHAQTSDVELTLRQTEDNLRGCLKDTGLGFNLNGITNGPGYGLKSMKERLTKLGGHLVIRTAPGKGTEISFELPLK